jgi:hypothetical protein
MLQRPIGGEPEFPKKFESFEMDQVHPAALASYWQAEEMRHPGILLQRRQAMTQPVLDEIATDIGGEDVNEAQTTFDRLLREYFTTLRIIASPETGDADSLLAPAIQGEPCYDEDGHHHRTLYLGIGVRDDRLR